MYGGLLGELFYDTLRDHQAEYLSMLECIANFQAHIATILPSIHIRIALILLEAYIELGQGV